MNTCQMNKTQCLKKKKKKDLSELAVSNPFLLSFYDPLPSVFYSLCCIESNFLQVTEGLHVVNLILNLRVT